MNLVLFGPPGAGKGTQSALLVERLKMRHISTGDLFRAAIKDGTELGRQAKAIMDRGGLVPDAVTIGLVAEVLEKVEGRSFILDGFPRNIVQAKALEDLLDVKGLKVDRTVFLQVPSQMLLERLSGRRVCTACGSTYHVDTKPTRVSDVCDVCGGNVVQRPDDKEDVISARLEAYEKSTQPLRDYYKAKGPYIEVDGTGASEDVYGRIAKALK